MTTQILPVPGASTAPPRRRRRGPLVALLVVAGVVVLGVVAFLVADAIAKDHARERVRERVAAVLGLDDPSTVEVGFGAGPILLQALTGRIDVVEVAVPELALGDVRGSASLRADGVPLDESAPVERIRIELAMDEAGLAAIAGHLSGLELRAVRIEAPEIVVASEFSLLGLPVPIGMAIAPSVESGDIVFTPTRVTVGEMQFAVADVLANPLFGPFAGPLLTQRSVCLADRLPASLRVTDVAVEAERLLVRISADGVALGGAAPGSCPG